MRDREVIDSELRRLAEARRSIRERGGTPSSRQVDRLLDERLGHPPGASESEAVDADAWSRPDKTGDIRLHRRKGVLRRFGLLAALPLSLVAVAAVLVVMFAVHSSDPAVQSTPPSAASLPPSGAPIPPSGAPIPPSGAPIPPSGARPNLVAPPGARPNLVAPPKADAPQLDIADRAFIDALKHEGVPVPSHEYAMSHGHAVCDFLAHQPNFAEAVRFVQRSSTWDADQSTDVTAGAIVSYCPQYETANSGEMQQTFQNALSDLQAIQDDLQGIRDGLRAIPGHP